MGPRELLPENHMKQVTRLLYLFLFLQHLDDAQVTLFLASCWWGGRRGADPGGPLKAGLLGPALMRCLFLWNHGNKFCAMSFHKKSSYIMLAAEEVSGQLVDKILLRKICICQDTPSPFQKISGSLITISDFSLSRCHAWAVGRTRGTSSLSH